MVDSARYGSVAPSVAGEAGANLNGTRAAPPALRRLILRLFSRKYGLQLHASAIAFIVETLEEHGLLHDETVWQESIEALAKGVVDDLARGEGNGSIVTRTALERVYESLLVADTAASATQIERLQNDATSRDPLTYGEKADPHRFFHVIDSFALPKIIFDERRKVFERSSQAPKLLPSASSKPAYLLERLNIIKSAVLRNENFLPPLAVGSGKDRDAFMKLTSTANLLGRQGQRFLLFGLLCTTSDGRYALEDADGVVGLDLEDAIPGEGIFTEGSIVLVEGEFTHEERIHVFAIGHPPSEPRKQARLLCNQVDFLGTGSMSLQEESSMKVHEQSHSDLAFVFISDLHLDQPKTLSSFRSMLQGYLDADFIPFAFVLCGSFLENSKTGKGDLISRYQEAFSSLGDVLSAFPSIIAASHFVFIPSPSDPFSSPTLPRSALSSAISSKLFARLNRPSLAGVKIEDHVHFTSNPARLRYFGQDIVVFREDLMGKMLRNTIRLKEEAREVDLKKYLVSTILDQAHLCPLPQQARPVLWNYDHTLRLYPMPTALVLADTFDRFELTYEGCHVFNPSRFMGSRFGWTTYYPASGRAERSELPL